MFLDGECVGKDLSWNMTETLVRTGIGPDGVIGTQEEFNKRLADLRLYVFDCVVDGKFDMPLKTRSAKIKSIIGDDDFREMSRIVLRKCPQIIGNITKARGARDICVKHGFEGVIIKDPNSAYMQGIGDKRSGTWVKLKMKPETNDAKIIGYQEGKGRHKGRLGALICQDPKTDVKFKIGTGLSDAQRKKIWRTRKNLLGTLVEYKFQKDDVSKSARFPVFVRLRLD
jgi:ATP-dependent DNA ligase